MGAPIAIMTATAVVTAVTAAALARRRSLVGARALAVLSLAVSWWAASYAAELAAGADVDLALRLGDVKYAGITLVPPAWLVFALQYTGRGDLVSRRLLLWLAVHPVAMLLLLALPATHDLVRGERVSIVGDGVLQVSVGPLFWVHFGYSTLLLATATVLLARSLLAVSSRYRPQSVVLGVASLLPWIASLSFNWPDTPVTVDPTPVVFALVEMVFVWGLGSFQLFNLVPIARSLVVDHLPQPILVIDPYERLVDANAAARRILSHDAGDVLDLSVRELLPSLPEDWLATAVEEGQTPLVRIGSEEGVAEYEVHVTALATATAAVPGRVLVLHDVTARRRTERRMSYVLSHDLLTDLPNRRMLDETLTAAVDVARSTGQAVGVLFVDLDGFKRVNDQAGHAVGDLVLRQLFLRVRDLVGPSAVAGRWGGDELVVVLRSLDHPEQAAELADRICAAVRGPIAALGPLPQISASIGLATSPPLPLDAPTLMRSADTAMYEAKERGGSRVLDAWQLPAGRVRGSSYGGSGLTAAPATGPRGPGADAAPRSSPR